MMSPREPQVPVRDTKEQTPPTAVRNVKAHSSQSPAHEDKTHGSPSGSRVTSTRNQSPTRPITQTSRAKRNLEQNYAASNHGNKQVNDGELHVCMINIDYLK